MTLKHTPAHTHHIPDTFVDETTGTHYQVTHDPDAESPLNAISTETIAVWAYRTPANTAPSLAKKPKGNIILDVFSAAYMSLRNDDRAKTLTDRWIKTYHPQLQREYSITTAVLRGSVQSEWMEVVVVYQPYAIIDINTWIEELALWSFGSTWCVEAVLADGTEDSISSIIAASPEDAVELYRQNYEPETTEKLRRYSHSLELIVEDEDPAKSLGKIQQLVSAIGESDALPTGITVKSVKSYSELKEEDCMTAATVTAPCCKETFPGPEWTELHNAGTCTCGETIDSEKFFACYGCGSNVAHQANASAEAGTYEFKCSDCGFADCI